MKVVILAGGLGTRISEESHLRPKPMIEIGGKPILWHIMKIYSYYGFDEFIICLGYKGYVIKEYFANYFLHESDVTFDFKNENKMLIHSNKAENWKVTLIDTGLETMTGGRLKKIESYIEEDAFMLTYGDGVANINISELLKFHESKKKIATITAVQPRGRFGVLELSKDELVNSFKEKPQDGGDWINGGFFVLNKGIFQFLDSNEGLIFEQKPLENLSSKKELAAYKHKGFWQPMDTLRDKNYLEELWKLDEAPWKIW